MTDIAHNPKGFFTFKTSPRAQFHPYELLNYTNQETIILQLKRTSEGMHKILNQHGFNTNKVHYIDIISKHVGSALENKNTTYLQKTDLTELVEKIEEKIKKLKPSPKNFFISDIHTLLINHGELKTKRFLDHLSNKLHQNFTKTIVLADHSRISKNIAKFLFNKSEKIIEKPN